jgi:pimeloyl-ACP methyl ester carboxylesterase
MCRFALPLNRHIITYKEFQIEYQIIGNRARNEGGHAWLAFHGFGRDSRDFEIFETLLEQNDTIYAFNLFQHGESRFPEKRLRNKPLTLDEHRNIIDFLLDHLKLGSFSLLGYSMGGKIALKTIESHASLIRHTLLIAPDGVKLNHWYRFVSGTSLGRSIYRSITRNPKPLFRLTDVSRFLGIISPKIHKFVYYHLETLEKRRLVGETWLIYRDFHPNLALVQRNINDYKIDTNLIYGTFDNVIKAWQGEKLNRGLDRDSLHLLKQGHLLLNEDTINYIRENDLWQGNGKT